MTTHVVSYCCIGGEVDSFQVEAIDGVLPGFVGYSSVPRTVASGDLVLWFSSISAAILYRVTDGGWWDPVDAQPAPGDFVVAVAPDAPLIQSGAIVTAQGGGQYRSAGGLGFQLVGGGFS